MQLSRFWPRFTIRRLILIVAITALISLVATNPYRHDGITDNRIVIPGAISVAVAYGIGSMRRPLNFFLPVLAAWLVTPTVYDRTPNLIDALAAGCTLGWIIGAPAGWLSRSLGRLDDPIPVAPDPPEPK